MNLLKYLFSAPSPEQQVIENIFKSLDSLADILKNIIDVQQLQTERIIQLEKEVKALRDKIGV